MNISLSPFAPEKLVSRDRFGRLVPRQLTYSTLRLNLVLTHHGIPPAFRAGVIVHIIYHPPLSGQSRVYQVSKDVLMELTTESPLAQEK